jgi:hypothetical protein
MNVNNMQTTILPAMTAREFIKFISLEDEDVEVFDKDEYQEYKNQEIKELNAR